MTSKKQLEDDIKDLRYRIADEQDAHNDLNLSWNHRYITLRNKYIELKRKYDALKKEVDYKK